MILYIAIVTRGAQNLPHPWGGERTLENVFCIDVHISATSLHIYEHTQELISNWHMILGMAKLQTEIHRVGKSKLTATAFANFAYPCNLAHMIL